MFILGEIVLRRIIVEESAGRCDLGTLVLHDEPDGEGTDYTEDDKTPHDASSDGTSVRASPSTTCI